MLVIRTFSYHFFLYLLLFSRSLGVESGVKQCLAVVFGVNGVKRIFSSPIAECDSGKTKFFLILCMFTCKGWETTMQFIPKTRLTACLQRSITSLRRHFAAWGINYTGAV